MLSTQSSEKKNFPIALIALYGLDMGIYSISAFMGRYGYVCNIISFKQLYLPKEYLANDYFTGPELQHEIYPDKDIKLLLDLLVKIRPRLIGLSVSSTYFRTAAKITQSIRQRLQTTIVWGGMHPISCPQDCIEHADIVCVGEGELPFLQIAERIYQGQPLSNISNTWISNNGQVEKNPMILLIDDLDNLPVPQRLSGNPRYFIEQGVFMHDPIAQASGILGAYPVMTSRGCAYSCSFCGNSILNSKYKNLGPYLRRRSVSHVIKELRQAIRHSNINLIRFSDDIFTYDKAWIKQFCEQYLEAIGKPFVCCIHHKHCSEEIIAALIKVGLVAVMIGIQSGSNSINKGIYKRNQNYKELIDFAKKMQLKKILVSFDIIADSCFDSEESRRQTIELLLSLPMGHRVVLYSLCFFPQTALTKQALSTGAICEADLEQHVSKAAHNFFLNLRQSVDKPRYFWNCLQAMAINPYFPRWLVRYIRDKNIFANYPYVLYWICWFWLNLFKQRGKRKKATHMPQAAMRDGSNMEEYVISPASRIHLQKSEKVLCLFPQKSDESECSFCLDVQNGGKSFFIKALRVEAISLRAQDVRQKIVWQFKMSIYIQDKESIAFRINYPYLFVRQQGSWRQVLPKKQRDIIVNYDYPYLVKVQIMGLRRFNFLPFNFQEVGRLIFSGRKFSNSTE